eukprot:g5775.t1
MVSGASSCYNSLGPYVTFNNYAPPARYRYFSVDVECVATGYDHNARAIGQIALVDEYERVLLDLYVKPNLPVVSYLTPLTGIARETLDTYGVSLEYALDALRRLLPKDGILVGQNIGKDVAWLQLKEGKDFHSMIDLAGLYKVWNSKFHSWTVFSLEHLSNVIFGLHLNGRPHNAVDDAIKSIRLHKYYMLHSSNKVTWENLKRDLLRIPAPLSFSKRYPRFQGVCMGNRKLCDCGAPFLGW